MKYLAFIKLYLTVLVKKHLLLANKMKDVFRFIKNVKFYFKPLYLKIVGAHIIFCLFFLSFGSAFAQKVPDIVSKNGFFKIDYTKGCAPLRVTVAFAYTGDIEGIDSYNFNWDASKPNEGFQAVKTHQYDQPGIYKVAVAFTALENGEKEERRDFIEVRVFKPYIPDFIIIPCSNHRATVEIADDTIYDKYMIYSDYFTDDPYKVLANDTELQYMGSSSDNIRVEGWFDDQGTNANCGTGDTRGFVTIDQINQPEIEGVRVLVADETSGTVEVNLRNSQNNIYFMLEYSEGGTGNFQEHSVFANSNRIVVDNLNTKDNYYCFRVTPLDGCDEGLSPSNVICSVILNAEAAASQNNLSWSTLNNPDPSTGFHFGEIILDGQPIDNADYPATSYTHTDVDCGEMYCYKIRLLNISGNYTESAEQCVEGSRIYTPPVMERIWASYNPQGDVEINWEAPPGISIDEYTIRRTDNGEIWNSGIENITVDAPEGIPLCYEISYLDKCGNQSDPAMACPVFLSESMEKNGKKIVWTSYTGLADGINGYMLEKTDEDGQLIEQINFPASVNEYVELPGDEQVIFYRIQAIPNGVQSSMLFSNTLKAVYSSTIFFPNAFTPDGDAINDTFKVVGQFLNNYELVIYNSWGEMVFQTNDPDEGWDGTYLNREAPQGAYVYSASMKDGDGFTIRKQGSVLLLRRK